MVVARGACDFVVSTHASERAALDAMKLRLKSDRTKDPETGAELGSVAPGQDGLRE